MRDDRQLDLFAWRAPCMVIPFPHDRLIGRARHLAALHSKSSEGAMRFIWKSEVETLDMAMVATGISLESRDHELEAFTSLVRHCLAEANGTAWGNTGGDAA